MDKGKINRLLDELEMLITVQSATLHMSCIDYGIAILKIATIRNLVNQTESNHDTKVLHF
jgi:hypothetical protein